MARRRSAATTPTGPEKPWRPGATIKLNRSMLKSLYQVYSLLSKETCKDVGLVMEVPVFIKDPLVALEQPRLGVQTIRVRLEAGLGDGPTSARVAVVDFNGDTQTLMAPVEWDEDELWFRKPQKGEWLPEAPSARKEQVHRDFIEKAIHDPHFHQVNVWAVVQRVLEFYEVPQALGRPVPWGFDGNRLIVVPHAGYGENAFYDQHSKSLQFYYFGDLQNPGYTCLSHDIVAHETGHAVLDGIRPMYNQLTSVQTAAFHEFIGDLTAILLAFHNQDIRQYVSQTTMGKLEEANVLADLAAQLGQEVEGHPYLRTAFNQVKMEDVQGSLSPHRVSQVLTGAMFEILMGIADHYLKRNIPLAETGAEAEGGGGAGDGAGGVEVVVGGETDEDATAGAAVVGAAATGAGAAAAVTPARRVTPAQALWWTADRFRRIALQPLDLCPPCDIQLVDYANCVIRNELLTNPVDTQGYRRLMLEVFHRRGLCGCGHQPGEDLPEDCQFREAFEVENPDLIYHDIGRVSRSRTAAYYFLSDNRRPLRIPAGQDVRVVDLYDTNKFGVGEERLPREVVLEYGWQEEVALRNDAEKGLDFGRMEGRNTNLECGGTLVFDERGNLLSWFRKPGTQHITGEREREILERKAAWEADPGMAKRQKIKRPTKLEMAELADLETGRRRIEALLKYTAELVRRKMIGAAQAENRFNEELKPVIAYDEEGTLRLEMAPNLRKSDLDAEEAGWKINY